MSGVNGTAHRSRLPASPGQPATPTLPSVFSALKADYAAAKSSKYRRTRRGLDPMGSGADRHYRNESDYLRIIEYARDMDRNDAIIGQILDRAVLNINQNGFSVDPATGDKELDLALWDRWAAWSEDPAACDAAGTDTYADLSDFALRAMFLDGDAFGLGLRDGTIEFIEAHRCRTPPGAGQNVVHGVEMTGETRRPLKYHFCDEDISPLAAARRDRFKEREAAQETPLGRMPVVWHLANRKRKSQTRGVSALAPIFDVCGHFEDLNFAKLIQAQIVSCIAIFRETAPESFPGGPDIAGLEQLGEREELARGDGTTEISEGITPGQEIRGRPGEKLSGFSPNVPNAEFFQHVRLILQIIGVNLGMPLVMVLMDASDTNFSGWRGAIDQAQRAFRRYQRMMVTRWHSPIYRWKVAQWISEDKTLAEMAQKIGPKVFAHQWNTPRWPYIQPLQDAQADSHRLERRLTSPRRLHAERGQDYDDVIAETVADNSSAIVSSIRQAEAISAQTGVKIDWRELLNVPIAMPLAPVSAPSADQPPRTPGAPGAQGGHNEE